MQGKVDITEEDKHEGENLQNLELLQLRRSDHEDAAQIESYIEVNKRSTYQRVYSSVEIMHFIETAFLPISVLSPDGKVVAFAAVDHSLIVSQRTIVIC